METRANYLIIGVFVLGVIASILGFIYWMRSDAAGPRGKNYTVLFDGSVSGLAEAAPVMFNGIKFGAVRSVSILPEDSRKVIVYITVRHDTPVRTNSRARINQQGLAGYVGVEITPGTPDAPLLEARPGESAPTIMGEAAGGTGLSGVGEAVSSANALLARLNNLVANNEDSLRQTLTNIEAFTATVAGRKDELTAIIDDARSLTKRLNEMSAKLNGAVDKIASDDPNSAVAQVQQAATSFRKLADKLDRSLGDKSIQLTEQAQRSLREFELFMKDGRHLADSLDRVVQKVERNPAAFLMGNQQSPKY